MPEESALVSDDSNRSSSALLGAGALDLVSITPLGAWLGLLAGGIASYAALARRYSVRQRALACVLALLGFVLAAFWWWFGSQSWI